MQFNKQNSFKLYFEKSDRDFTINHPGTDS